MKYTKYLSFRLRYATMWFTKADEKKKGVVINLKLKKRGAFIVSECILIG